MTITNGYLTSGEASDYTQRQFADTTGILDDIVTVASRDIDRYCGRHFYQHGTTDTPIARVFNVEDADELNLGTYNDLVSVTTLKAALDGDGVYEHTYDTSHYVLCPAGATTRAPEGQPYTGIELLTGYEFPTGVNTGRRALIEVTGVWGWPAVPIAVKHSARIIVAELAKLRDAPLGMVGSDQYGMARIPPQKQRHVRELLAPYIHPEHLGIA